jgi:integrase
LLTVKVEKQVFPRLKSIASATWFSWKAWRSGSKVSNILSATSINGIVARKMGAPFFLREQEASHMTWDDVKIGAHSVRVTAKSECRCPSCGADGFNIKDFEEREIPDLDDWFIDVLKARKAAATCDLLFYNGNGNPEGHFLYKLKRVGKRAGIKCKNCVDRDGKLFCKRHTVNTHKWRRTFATWHHVLGGVSIAILHKWLGHSDVETTMRYIATTEIRPGLNRERTKLTWTGIAAKPKLVSVA